MFFLWEILFWRQSMKTQRYISCLLSNDFDNDIENQFYGTIYAFFDLITMPLRFNFTIIIASNPNKFFILSLWSILKMPAAPKCDNKAIKKRAKIFVPCDKRMGRNLPVSRTHTTLVKCYWNRKLKFSLSLSPQRA